jgi:thimet oligopeptidase
MILATLLAIFPLFQNIQDISDYLPMSDNSIEALTETSASQFQIDLEQFLAIPIEKRTFDNTVRFWDAFNGDITQSSVCLEALTQIYPEKELRDKADSGRQKLDRTILNALTAHPEIYSACLSLQNEHLSEVERYYLDRLLLKFKRLGMQLNDDGRARFSQIKQDISALESQFERHVAEDTSVLFIPKEELVGLDESWFESRKQNAEGAYQLDSDLPTYMTVLANCQLRKTRKAMFELFMNKAYPQNEEIAVKLIEKRNQLAQLLGYPTYAAYDLSDQMVLSPERATAFIKEIGDKASAKAETEFKIVTENLPEGVLLNSSGQLERFDELYVFSTYKKEHFSVDQGKIAEYFPADKTIQGLIGIYEQFFSLSIQEVAHSIPIPDLKTLEIRNAAGELLGTVLLDLFPREGKCSHQGVCFSIIRPYSPPQGPDYPALSLIIGNFTKPIKGREALMKHAEVVTFFHEFGHAIHCVLGRNEFFAFGGMAVKRDFVEVPSMLLENWVWNPSILKMISSHYLTGESLSDELIQKMIQARDFGFGTGIESMCYRSELSLAFFNQGDIANPTQLMLDTWARALPRFSPGENNHFHTSWWHFPNYGPKYYSYLWSGAFAQALFEKIDREGLLNPEVGAAYVRTILGKGGSKDPEQMLIDFLGAKPTLEPYLRKLNNL